MSKNGIVLSIVAVLLAVVYVIYFTDLFHTPTMQIIPQIRPGRASAIPRGSDQPPVAPVSFAFNGKYKLTEVKVVQATDLATNKNPKPLWHLISESNSAPQKAIVYGGRIIGMKPAVPRMRPEPLEPEVQYTLIVKAGNVIGQTNFFTREVVRPQ